jgi:hypothetical protein
MQLGTLKRKMIKKGVSHHFFASLEWYYQRPLGVCFVQTCFSFVLCFLVGRNCMQKNENGMRRLGQRES